MSRQSVRSVFSDLLVLLALAAASILSGQVAFSQTKPHPLALAHNVASGTAAAQPVSGFRSTSAVEPLAHIITGRSVFVNTKSRLTRVYVTNPEVLDSYTASPTEVVITAKKPGISTVIVWDETGASKSYTFSSDINVEGLQDSLRQAMPNEAIEAHASEGHIVLTGLVGTDAISDAALKLASNYSKEISNSLLVNPAKVKQVKLQVRIVEVERSKLDAFAFNFFSAGGNILGSTTTSQSPTTLTVSNSGGGSGSSVGGKSVTVSDPLNFLLYSSRLNIGATLKDLENRQLLQILAEPNITTLSGQKASFLAGGEFPFPVVQGGGGAGSSTSISIQFRPYGVKLEFTPQVNTDGSIELHVIPEVSALDYSNAVTISGYTIPALSTRRADTQVVLRSGQSFAISGLLDQQTTDQLGRTPGIASVPILGQLFKSKNINHSRTELVVIVTPNIVDPLTENLVPEEPHMVISPLQPAEFDKNMPAAKNKKP